MGTTARELLDLAGGVDGGRPLGAIQPGGASSNFIGPGQLDVELDFGTLQAAGSMLGSGAMVVMAEGTDLLAAATNVLRFFRDESCGKCVPCRVGSTKAHVILDDLLAAGGGPGDVNGEVRDLAEVMRRTSICGLGQVALGPVVSVLGLAASEDREPTEADADRRGSSSPPARSRRPWPDSGRGAARQPRTCRWARRCAGCPAQPVTAPTRCPASPGPPSTGTPSAPPTPTGSPRGCPATSPDRRRPDGRRAGRRLSPRARAVAMPTGGALPPARTRW